MGDVIEVLPSDVTFPIAMRSNRMVYHPQNVALLQWFEDQSPSSALGGLQLSRSERPAGTVTHHEAGSPASAQSGSAGNVGFHAIARRSNSRRMSVASATDFARAMARFSASRA